MQNKLLLLIALFLHVSVACASERTVLGVVVSEREGTPLQGASVDIVELRSRSICDSSGEFVFKRVPEGTYVLRVSMGGFETEIDTVTIGARDTTRLELTLTPIEKQGKEIVVVGSQERGLTTGYMPAVEGTGIYEGKKNEVLLLQKMDANLATNNSRQVFSKVPGMNIVESDGGGIQLGVAVRGLNPNRITEFNSRQNGYDISADALGYPESYYTPPMEGLRKIEVIRGAASLQYGSQFGGLLNFVMQEGALDKAVEVRSMQSGASFGFFNSFNSIGGTVGGLNYFGFYHHKQGDGWRENSGFNVNTGYAAVRYDIADGMRVGVNLTLMKYEMQQPGGLTDAQFEADPRQSNRDRNWFTADWTLPAVTLDYAPSASTRISSRLFALLASRGSVGNLIAPSQMDYRLNRNLMVDNYQNYGMEARVIHNYSLGSSLNTLLVGLRYYQGNTHRRQGLGSSGNDADFSFLNPEDLESSDYTFPSTNAAVFAENIIVLSEAISITPGFRFERISTNATGYYKSDGAKRFETKNSTRSFPLFGVGLTYHNTARTDFYFNISQAFSGVNFNDIRVVSPTSRVDSNLHDVRGYNMDFGFRGTYRDWLSFDVGGFYLAYNDRIGVVTVADENYNIFRFRTNVSDSRSLGFEGFSEVDLLRMLSEPEDEALALYTSVAYVDARYLNAVYKGISNNRVEYAPEWIVRTGLTYRLGAFSISYQHSLITDQFTDATNTLATPNSVNGVIPSYHVGDLSMSYRYGMFQVGAGVNNVLDARYFTRRAEGYPGPGILPADGRSGYLSLGVRL